MKNLNRRPLSKILLGAVALFAATAAQASIVWDLNPADQNGPVGGSSRTYTNSGFSITAYGFDNNAGVGTPHDLYYKSVPDINGASERGLGLTNTPSNELQANMHFIQFDFTAAIVAGMFNGELSVGSVQEGESFAIFGSNTLGTLGTQVSGVFGTSSDNQFVAIPNFGQFNYYSVMALSDDVLPVAVRADVAPVPEISSLMPIMGLFAAVGSTHMLRRRRQTRIAREKTAV